MPIDAPWNGTSGITYEGQITGSPGSFSHTFPKASVTCIWINPDPQGVSGQNSPQSGYIAAAPNPSTGSVTFQYSLQESSETRIDIFSIEGRLVQSLDCSPSAGEGFHSEVWDGRNSNGTFVPAGIYVAKLTAAGSRVSRVTKLILF